MKNIVMLSAILAVVSVPAAAVQKCVALGSGTTCTATGGLSRPPTGLADWELTCTTNRESVTVKGIGVCAATRGEAGALHDSLRITTCTSTVGCPADGQAINCWCRMLSPALSQWMHSGLTFRSEYECMYNCAAECYQYIINEQILRTALFSTSTLSD